MISAQKRMHKPIRIATPFQVTAAMDECELEELLADLGTKQVRIKGIESVPVLQLLKGRKHHELVSYRSKNDKYLFKCSLI